LRLLASRVTYRRVIGQTTTVSSAANAPVTSMVRVIRARPPGSGSIR
jgi:hypothetical protein